MTVPTITRATSVNSSTPKTIPSQIGISPTVKAMNPAMNLGVRMKLRCIAVFDLILFLWFVLFVIPLIEGFGMGGPKELAKLLGSLAVHQDSQLLWKLVTLKLI